LIFPQIGHLLVEIEGKRKWLAWRNDGARKIQNTGLSNSMNCFISNSA